MRIPQASELFISGLSSTELTKKELELIEDNRLGGIILFSRNIESLAQVVELNQTIIKANPINPPLISVDQEGGRVARLRGICTDLPPMAAVGEVGKNDPYLAYRLGAMQGRELTSLGFNLNFAPVCDILSHEKNTVIGDRAFAKKPADVALLASKYIQGLQGAGVAACAKHFPGHGATHVDSHLALPTIDIDYDVLWARELVPFKAAIEAEVATIMTAHIVTTAIDSLPATLSPKALNDLLRNKLNYGKVIISDDLDMKAVADHYSLPQILEQGLSAGIDLFIIGNDFDKTLEAIDIVGHLIKRNEKIRNLAITAAFRLDKLRERYIGKPHPPDLASALNIVRCPPHLKLVLDLPKANG